MEQRAFLTVTFKRIVDVTSILVATLLIGGFLVSQRGAEPFGLHFNAYAIPSFVAVLANIVLLVLINRQKDRPPESIWFSLFVSQLALWGALEAMQRMSITPEGALFWYRLTPVAWIPLGATLFIYALALTGQLRMVSGMRGILSIIGVSVLGIGLARQTDLIVHYDVAQAIAHPWGYYFPYGQYFIPLLVWLEMFLILALIMMYNVYRHTSDRTVKRRTLYNMIGLLIPIIGGTFTDGIFPAFHIQVLPVAVLLSTAMALVIGYGAIRYRIFSTNEMLAASNILASMSEFVLILNNDYEVEYANPSSQRLLGYSPESLIGGNISRLFNLADYERIIKQLNSSTDTTKIVKERYEIFNSTNEKIPALLSIDLVSTPDLPRAGYVVVATDLSTTEKIAKENLQLEETKRAMLNALEDAQALEHELEEEKASVERKVEERSEQLLREQARLQASINSLQVGFMITDEKQHLLSTNTAAETILGVNQGKTVTDMSANLAKGIDFKAKVEQCLKKRKPVSVREVLIGTSYIHIFITPILLDEEHAIGTVILLQDVSEEKALQRSRDEFFSIASHELRTPLTAIRGNTSLIQTYYAEELAKNQPIAEMIDDIHDSSIRLIEIVNDFLDVSRLEQGGIEFKLVPTDVNTITKAVADDLASVGDAKGTKIINKVGHQPAVTADPDRFKQIIYNLVGNAMKFTENGTITIAGVKEGKNLRIQIIDTGVGIPADKQHLLFHKFQQAGNSILTRDTTRGTGLGLYISKLLIEKMGGQISLDTSEPGKGSTFSFTIPFATDTPTKNEAKDEKN